MKTLTITLQVRLNCEVPPDIKTDVEREIAECARDGLFEWPDFAFNRAGGEPPHTNQILDVNILGSTLT